MKNLLLLVFICPCITNAQLADTSFAQIDAKFQNASKELTKFHSQFQSGILLEVVGGVLVGLGAAANREGGAGQVASIGGLLVSLAGFIMNVSSSSHIKNAGLYLKNGSLIMPINNKKPIKNKG